MAGLAIGGYQTSGSVGSYQTAAATGVIATPATVAFTTALFAPVVVASTNITLTPGVLSLITATWAPQFGGDVEVRPGTGTITAQGATIGPPTVINWVTTTGQWSNTVTFAPGDEWIVTCSGPAAIDRPRIRVQLLFT